MIFKLFELAIFIENHLVLDQGSAVIGRQCIVLSIEPTSSRVFNIDNSGSENWHTQGIRKCTSFWFMYVETFACMRKHIPRNFGNAASSNFTLKKELKHSKNLSYVFKKYHKYVKLTFWRHCNIVIIFIIQ